MVFSMVIGLSTVVLYSKGSIAISLHFLGLSFIRFFSANSLKFSATMFIKLVEFLGIVSKAVVSSTNFVLKFQSMRSSLVITENNITPNLVPCGIPPFGDFH